MLNNAGTTALCGKDVFSVTTAYFAKPLKKKKNAQIYNSIGNAYNCSIPTYGYMEPDDIQCILVKHNNSKMVSYLL